MCWSIIKEWFKKPYTPPTDNEVAEQTIENEEHIPEEQKEDEHPKEDVSVELRIKAAGFKEEIVYFTPEDNNKNVCLQKLPEQMMELTIKSPGCEPKTVLVNCALESENICLDGNDKPYGAAKQKKVVLLDNGHASSTPGKRSPKFDDGTQFFEYEFNRDIVKRLSVLLDKAGIEYEVIVPEVEKDVSLTERANRTNKLCREYGKDNCLLISVHANAFGMGDKWENPAGWEVWTCKGHSKSDDIAKMFWEEAKAELDKHEKVTRDGKVQGGGNPGPSYEANFTVLAKTSCPAILTENMFYTNKEEAKWLMSDVGRDTITLIHFNGIKRWLESE